MYGNYSSELPIGFAMALAGNPQAMNNFLKMENEKQDSIIEKARTTKTQREMQQLVNGISIT